MTNVSDRRIKTLLFLLIFMLVSFLIAWKLYERFLNNDLSKRESMYCALAEEIAAKHSVPSALVKAVIWKESRWQANVVGGHGEIGLMQITDGAVADWQRLQKKDKKPSRKDLFKPELNIEIGTWYLSWTSGHWKDYKAAELLQLAEYNAGYTRVNTLWKPKNPQDDLALEKISFPSTRDYIRQVLERKKYYEKLENTNYKN